MYAVYILTNKWKTVLYVGVTDSLENRLAEHKDDRFNGFTRRYNCTQLVYAEPHEDAASASKREKQLKGWTRARKEALIASVNPDWEDVSAQAILRFAQDS